MKHDAVKTKKNHVRTSLGSKIFDVINYTFLGVICLIMVLPFVNIISSSLTPLEDLVKNPFILIPTRVSLEAYSYIFSTNTVIHGLQVSIGITLVGTTLNILLTAMTAYPLAHQKLVGRKVLVSMVVFCMVFNGGMIPTFIIVKNLGLLNTYWSLILPTAISSFNLMLFKNYFQELPQELEEAAKLAGYNDVSILFRIILPISKPLIATFVVMFGVEHWNSWFNAILYLNNSKMWPIQVILRQIITGASQVGDAMGGTNTMPAATVRNCTIVIATVPILLVYPFLQKYFTKGLLVGSVKG